MSKIINNRKVALPALFVLVFLVALTFSVSVASAQQNTGASAAPQPTPATGPADGTPVSITAQTDFEECVKEGGRILTSPSRCVDEDGDVHFLARPKEGYTGGSTETRPAPTPTPTPLPKPSRLFDFMGPKDDDGQNEDKESPKGVESVIQRLKTINSETQNMIRERVRNVDEDDERPGLLMKREEERGQIRARAIERTRAYVERIVRRLDAAVERLENLADKVDSRISKLEEKFSARGLDLSNAKALLAEARVKIQEARTAVGLITPNTDQNLNSDDPRTSFEGGGRALIEDARDAIKDAHRALVEAIREVKVALGNTGLTPRDGDDDSDDDDSDDDDSDDDDSDDDDGDNNDDNEEE